MIVLKLGDLRPFVFREMRKLLAVSKMVGRLILLWFLGRNPGGIAAVLVRQNWSLIYPIPFHGKLVVVNNCGMIDALATLWPTSAASVRMIGPSIWKMSSLSCVFMISFMQLRIACIERAKWALSCICTAAVLRASWPA